MRFELKESYDDPKPCQKGQASLSCSKKIKTPCHASLLSWLIPTAIASSDPINRPAFIFHMRNNCSAKEKKTTPSALKKMNLQKFKQEQKEAGYDAAVFSHSTCII